MSMYIKADTIEELYTEAALAIMDGFKIVGTAMEMGNGRWCLEMGKE